jgi:alpha-1,3-glucanase-like protein/carbohydrate binding protein with CBM6 domain
MKKFSILKMAAVALATLTSSVTVNAQNITWGSATGITGDANLVTSGTYVDAFLTNTSKTTSLTADGVTFNPATSSSNTSGTDGKISFTVTSGTNLPYSTNAFPTASPSSTAFAALMNSGGTYENGGTGAGTVTLSGLISGHTYAVQVFNYINDGDAGLTKLSGTTPVTLSNAPGAGGSGTNGEYATGTFTATGTTETFNWNGQGSGYTLLGSISVRDTTNAPQTIVWGPATGITGDANLVTSGTYMDAFLTNTSQTTSLTADGVTFNPATSSSSTSGSDGVISFNVTSGTNLPYSTNAFPTASPSSPAFAALMNSGGTYENGGSRSGTVIISGLISGHTYAVQVFNYINDGDAGLTKLSGTTPVTLSNAPGAGGSGTNGEFATGTFTASGPNEAFNWNGQGSAYTILGAISVRDTTPPPQTIVWGSATGITGDANLVTSGTYVDAFLTDTSKTTSLTADGVTFNPATSSSSTSGSDGLISFTVTSGTNISYSSNSFPTASPSSTAFAAIMNSGGAYENGGSGAGTVIISGLISGHTYAVQVFNYVNDGDAGLTKLSGTTPVTLSNPPGAGGSGTNGEFATGTFTASGPTEAFNWNGQGSSYTILGAISVRDTTPPPQTIVWGSATGITGDANLAVSGRYFDALLTNTSLTSSLTADGITFNQQGSSSSTSGSDGLISFNVTSGTNTPYSFNSFPTASPSSPAFAALMNSGGTFENGGAGAGTVTLSGLTSGHAYAVQVFNFANDGDAGLTKLSGTTPVTLSNPPGAGGSGTNGEFATGTFMATGPTEAFNWNGQGSSYTVLGSISVCDTSVATPSHVGATTPFTSVEAESGTLAGGAAVVSLTSPPTTEFSSPQLEASGHAYVALTGTGQSVTLTNTTGQNITAINVRECIPDSTTGGGITATLDMYVNGVFRQALNLSSAQTWVYETTSNYNGMSQTPSSGNPHVFWDEVPTFITGAAVAPGSTITFKQDSSNMAAFYYIDVVDLEAPPAALTQPANSLSITSYGAVANNSSFDNTSAIQACINAAQSSGQIVWIPAGTFYVTSGATMDANGITIEGAGPWYSTVFETSSAWAGNQVFYGKSATFQNLSIDASGPNSTPGLLAILSKGDNWTINNVWARHTMLTWADGSNGMIENSRVNNSWGDGMNINNSSGTACNNVTITNNFSRGNGDDAYALNCTNTSAPVMTNITITNNTGVASWWGNEMGIYGGSNVVVENNLLHDSVKLSGMVVGVFGNGYGLTTGLVEGNTVVRGGSFGYGNQNPGIKVGGGSSPTVLQNVVVSSNTVADAMFDAIDLSTSTNPVLQYNTINAPGLDGINVDGGSTGSATVINNTVTDLNAGQSVFANGDSSFPVTAGTPACSYSSENSVQTETCAEGGLDVTNLGNGSYTEYNDVNINGLASFAARVASAGSGGTISIYLDKPTGNLIGTCTVSGTGGSQTWTTQTCSLNLNGATGFHNVYLVYSSGFSIAWFTLNP